MPRSREIEEPAYEPSLEEQAKHAQGVELAEQMIAVIEARPDDHPLVIAEKQMAEADAAREEAAPEPEPEPEPVP